MWYATMLEQDETEAYNKKLDELEYLAAFINPKAVEKLRNDRNPLPSGAENKWNADPEEFNKLLEALKNKE